MKISAGLGGSKLEARGGIIGGNIELQGLESEGNHFAINCPVKYES
jgi:hypothetical protein